MDLPRTCIIVSGEDRTSGYAKDVEATQVAVTLSEFAVRLNGVEMNNQYAQYPLLVYQNIAYFPITCYGSRFMGVETTWSREKGIGVHQNGVRWNWHDYKRYLPNSRTGTATIRTGPILVNNRPIDNSAGGFFVVNFSDAGTWAYKTMILSRKGKVLFKTTERTASMVIENGQVSFVKLRNA